MSPQIADNFARISSRNTLVLLLTDLMLLQDEFLYPNDRAAIPKDIEGISKRAGKLEGLQLAINLIQEKLKSF